MRRWIVSLLFLALLPGLLLAGGGEFLQTSERAIDYRTRVWSEFGSAPDLILTPAEFRQALLEWKALLDK